jgi:hypothetical protein
MRSLVIAYGFVGTPGAVGAGLTGGGGGGGGISAADGQLGATGGGGGGDGIGIEGVERTGSSTLLATGERVVRRTPVASPGCAGEVPIAPRPESLGVPPVPGALVVAGVANVPPGEVVFEDGPPIALGLTPVPVPGTVPDAGVPIELAPLPVAGDIAGEPTALIPAVGEDPYGAMLLAPGAVPAPAGCMPVVVPAPPNGALPGAVVRIAAPLVVPAPAMAPWPVFQAPVCEYPVGPVER